MGVARTTGLWGDAAGPVHEFLRGSGNTTSPLIRAHFAGTLRSRRDKILINSAAFY